MAIFYHKGHKEKYREHKDGDISEPESLKIC
jgi:hypothetical protein